MRLTLKTLFVALAVTFLVVMQASSTSVAAQGACGETLEKEWFHEPEPKDWGGLYRLFRKYALCDDGAIAEGFSDEVAQLLVKDWKHLGVLTRLTASDERFREFVIRHIDATLSEEELKAIIKNAMQRCPSGKGRFCQTIRAEAENALREL